MIETTKYSVLLPVYISDNAEWFRVAIESMKNQTLPPDEIVIAVDGSVAKEIDEVISEYEVDKNLFSIYRYKINEGLGSTLRKTVPLCRNEYIARMDADDYSLPERCEMQINFLNNHPDIGVVGSHVSEFFNGIDNIVSIRKVPSDHDEIVKFAKRRSPINHPTIVFRKTDILRVGNYSDLIVAQDYELIVRMIQGGIKLHNINISLMKMRIDKHMYKRRGGRMRIKAMYYVQKGFIQNGFYSSKMEFYIGFVPYLFAYLLPGGVRKFIWNRLLRTSA